MKLRAGDTEYETLGSEKLMAVIQVILLLLWVFWGCLPCFLVFFTLIPLGLQLDFLLHVFRELT